MCIYTATYIYIYIYVCMYVCMYVYLERAYYAYCTNTCPLYSRNCIGDGERNVSSYDGRWDG